jgi:hypothetical protein
LRTVARICRDGRTEQYDIPIVFVVYRDRDDVGSACFKESPRKAEPIRHSEWSHSGHSRRWRRCL